MFPPIWLSVLGTDYRVQIDHAELRECLTTLFGRFLRDSPPAGLPRKIEVRTGKDPAVVLDGQARRLAPEGASQQAFIILNEIFLSEASGCRVLHAAALTSGDGVALVAGPSTYGKSTLSLLLLERGLGFLGDDFAPLDLATGRILPFPKRIGIRPRVQELLSPLTRSRLEAAPERWLGDKRVVDLEELFPGQLAEPAPVRLVVLLVPPGGPPDPSRQVLQIGTLHELPQLAEALAPFGELQGPEGTDEDAIRAYTLEWSATEGGGVRGLAAALDPFTEKILFVEKVAGTRPRFDGEPTLTPASPSRGLLTLASDLLDRNGPRGRLLDETEDTTALVFQLGRHLGQARFMHLQLGRFDAMADLIAGAARSMR